MLSPRGQGAFAVLGDGAFRAFLTTFFLTMMADNVEHVISYWVVFQRFHSPALGGFAVVAHWLPYLVLSMPVGALNDRLDSRRLIQLGALLFMAVSVGWGVLFYSDTLKVWHAMVLLVLHGCAGVFWMTSSQVLLYAIVGSQQIESAVRLNATARYLGTLVGPGLGSLLLLGLGPTWGIFFNAACYLPLVVWLLWAPKPRVSPGPAHGSRLRDLVQTFSVVRQLPTVLAMVLLSGAAAFLVGNSYQAQMPGFAADLGRGDPGVAYAALLAADAAGALCAGIALETIKSRFSVRPRTAARFALGWGLSLASFALIPNYWLALPLLFLAGFFELAFGSMAQTLVQMKAPAQVRGRVLGLFSMASSGLRTFSGLWVGWLGNLTNIHVSLALAASVFAVWAAALTLRSAEPHA